MPKSWRCPSPHHWRLPIGHSPQRISQLEGSNCVSLSWENKLKNVCPCPLWLLTHRSVLVQLTPTPCPQPSHRACEAAQAVSLPRVCKQNPLGPINRVSRGQQCRQVQPAGSVCLEWADLMLNCLLRTQWSRPVFSSQDDPTSPIPVLRTNAVARVVRASSGALPVVGQIL